MSVPRPYSSMAWATQPAVRPSAKSDSAEPRGRPRAATLGGGGPRRDAVPRRRRRRGGAAGGEGGNVELVVGGEHQRGRDGARRGRGAAGARAPARRQRGGDAGASWRVAGDRRG